MGSNKSIIAIVLFLMGSWSLRAQELRCDVQVLGPKLTSTADKETLEALQGLIIEFLNNRAWTEDKFGEEEKIECSFVLTIDSKSGDNFQGSLQVQSRRPIYNTSYHSNLFNFKDKDITFIYARNTPIDFSKGVFLNNLTSILAYYVYMVLGYDYDSYEEFGGDAYFTEAQNITVNAQNAIGVGWKAADSQRNRYWLVDNALHEVYKPLRKTYYEYHRKGLDKMYDSLEVARNLVFENIKGLEKIQKTRPGNVNLYVFMQSKSDELINLISKVEAKEKQELLVLFKKIDPVNIPKYEKILNER